MLDTAEVPEVLSLSGEWFAGGEVEQLTHEKGIHDADFAPGAVRPSSTLTQGRSTDRH
jgi:hypothetical protein